MRTISWFVMPALLAGLATGCAPTVQQQSGRVPGTMRGDQFRDQSLLPKIREAEIKMAISGRNMVHEEYLNNMRANPTSELAQFLEAYTNPDTDAAEPFFSSAVIYAADKSAYCLALGAIYTSWKLDDRALHNLDMAYSLDKGNFLALYYKGQYHNRRDERQAALRVVNQAIEIDPSFPLSHELAGDIFLQIGDKAKALSEYQKAVNLDPLLFHSRYNLAVLLEEKGLNEDAAREYELAADLGPGNFEAQMKLAAILEKNGKLQESSEVYARAAKLNPRDPEVHMAMARLAVKMGNSDAEYNELEKAAKLSPTNAELQLKIAWMALDRGNLDRAEKSFMDAVKAKSTDSMIYVGLGRIMLKKGLKRKAIDQFRRALLIESGNKQAREGLDETLRSINVSPEKYGGKNPQATYSMFSIRVLKIYKTALKTSPEIKGAVTVRVTVDSSGNVLDASLEQCTLKNADLETSIYGTALMAKFPPGKDGTKYNLPLSLHPGG